MSSYPGTTAFAKRLRRDATDAEKILWNRIRAKQLSGVKFRRQEPFLQYILDFMSYEKRLVIELDGGQHAENQEYDRVRNELLKQQGFTVLRFWNNEVMQNLDGVLARIYEHCITLPLAPSHPGRGNK